MRTGRTWRRGDSAEAVRSFQQKLQSHGYDVGEIDGLFGYVTENALLKFQRDFRLKADGIIGPRTAYALQQAPPRHRLMHIVRRGERITDVAAQYGMSVAALRWMNALKPHVPLRPGRRLIVWRPYVLLSPDPMANVEVVDRTLRSNPRKISGLAAPFLPCRSDGSVERISIPDYEAIARQRGWDFFLSVRGQDESLATIVTSRRNLRRFMDSLQDIRETTGVTKLFLELELFPMGGGARLEQVCRLLRRCIPRATIVLSTPPLPRGWRSFATGFNADAAARHVDAIVMDVYHWQRLLDRSKAEVDFGRITRWIADMSRQIPPWKVWLGLPFGGHLISGEWGGDTSFVTYQKAIGEALRRGVRPTVDDSGFLRIPGDDDAELMFQGRDSLRRFLDIALRFRLSGLYFHGVGGEDRRLWDVLAHRVEALALGNVKPPS